MSDEHDLEGYWSDFRPPPLVHLKGAAGGLELAAAKASFDIAHKFQTEPDIERVIRVATAAIESFLHHWREDLLVRGPAGIIELVLEDQGLAVVELKLFVRALPESLIKRIVTLGAAGSSANGIHALLAIEYHYRINRRQFDRDYELTRDGETLIVTLYPTRAAADLPNPPLQFRLDDTFDLSALPG